MLMEKHDDHDHGIAYSVTERTQVFFQVSHAKTEYSFNSHFHKKSNQVNIANTEHR